MNDTKCKFPPPIHLELSTTKSPNGQFFSFLLCEAPLIVTFLISRHVFKPVPYS